MSALIRKSSLLVKEETNDLMPNIPVLSMVQQGILFQNVIQAVKNRIVDDQKNNKRNYSYKQNNFFCQGWHFGVFTGKSVTVTGLFSYKNVALQMHDAEKGQGTPIDKFAGSANILCHTLPRINHRLTSRPV